MNKEVKTQLNFGSAHIVLLLEDSNTFANNVIAYNDQGQEMWRINDIIKAKEPCGNSVINKKMMKL